MNVFQLFKQALFQPRSLFPSINITKKKSFWYFLLLSLLLLISPLATTYKTVVNLQKELDSVVEKMPDFSIENGELEAHESKNNSFIYQNDFVLLAFDAADKMTPEDFKSSLKGQQIGFALLKQQFVISSADNSLFASIFENQKLTYKYSAIDTTDWNKEMFNSVSLSTKQKVLATFIFLILLFIPTIFNFGLFLVIGTFIAHVFARAKIMGLNFGKSFKLFLVASTLPLVFSVVVSIFFPSIDPVLLTLLGAMVIYSHNIRDKKIELIKKNMKK